MEKACRILLKLLILLGISIVFVSAVPFIVLIYPVYILNRPLCIRLSTFFTYTTWSLTSLIFNMSTTIEGRNIMGEEDYFVISNHLGSVDFMLINEIARKNNMIAHLKYAVKDGLRVFPVFYQMLVYIGFLVLRRSFESDRQRIVRYFGFFKNNQIPMWFVLYPEGSRFSEKLKTASWEYSDRKGMRRLDNVLFPRYKGFKLVCEQLRGTRIRNIADITFFYMGGETPPLWKFLLGDPSGKFRYDIKITPIDEIDNYEEFLYRSFERKDALIADWKRRHMSS